MISKNRTRKLVLTIIALFMISTFTPVISLFVKGLVISKFPVEVVVDNGDGTTDTLRLADHTSSVDGNWIELTDTNGDSITLPSPIEVKMSSTVDSKQFTYQGKTVNINTYFTWPKEVIYPFTTHNVYYDDDPVQMEFSSSITYTGDTVELRLVEGTLNGVRNLVTEALNGNIEPMKQYLADNEVVLSGTTEFTLSGANSFAFTYDFGALNVGDYVAVVLVETDDGTDYVLDIYSLTPIEVLDYDLTVSQSYNAVQENLEVEVTVEGATGSSYSYGTVLINQDIYSVFADVNTDGTLTGTTVDVGVDSSSTLYRVIENQQFLGVSLNDYSSMISQSFWQDILVDLETAGVLTAGDIAFAIELESTSSSLTGLDALVLDASDCQGTYWLMTIVWEHGGGKIVAFDQQEVTLGQAVSLNSITTNLPQAYANIVTLDYEITSDTVFTGAIATFTFSIDGTPIALSTDAVTIDIAATTETFNYEWDTLIDVAENSYRFGGSVDYTVTITDSSLNELATLSGSGVLIATSKASLFTDRLNAISFAWGQPGADKATLFGTYLTPISFLWGLV